MVREVLLVVRVVRDPRLICSSISTPDETTQSTRVEPGLEDLAESAYRRCWKEAAVLSASVDLPAWRLRSRVSRPL